MNNKPTLPTFRNQLIFSAIAVTIMLAISAWAWGRLPDNVEIPLHWNASGEVDRYGGKAEGLLLLPAITAGLAMLLYVVPRIDPRRENLAQSVKPYGFIWIGITLLMLLIHLAVIMSVFGKNINMGLLIPLAVGILFIGIGNYMGKIRSNFYMGIRTPWTLSSELSWNKTHRLGGRLFIGMGLIMLVSAFFGGTFWAGAMLTSVLGGTAVLVVYSYFVWKNDPDVQHV